MQFDYWQFIRARLRICFERGLFKHDPMTLELVMDGLMALPEDTKSYMAGSLASIEGKFNALDCSPDVMTARMLHHGTPIKYIEDTAFLRANTDIAWNVMDDWEENPDEDDWSLGPAALRMNMQVLTHHDLNGFRYDPSVSIRNHEQRAIDQCRALVNVAWEIEAEKDIASQKTFGGWQQHKSRILTKPLLIEDVAVAQLCVDHPELEDAIISFIGTRGYDSDLLIEVFGRGGALPLNEGVL